MDPVSPRRERRIGVAPGMMKPLVSPIQPRRYRVTRWAGLVLLSMGLAWGGYYTVQTFLYVYYQNVWEKWGARPHRTESEREEAQMWAAKAAEIRQDFEKQLVFSIPPILAAVLVLLLARRWKIVFPMNVDPEEALRAQTAGGGRG